MTGKINFLFYFRMLSVFMKFLLAPKKVEENNLHSQGLSNE